MGILGLENSKILLYLQKENMIEQPPKLTSSLLNAAVTRMREPEVMESISDINQRYLYWSDVKYRKAGTITGKELWAAVRLSRYSLYAYVWPAYQISVPVTNHMQEMCHNFDMNFGGVWGTDSIIPKDGQEKFLNSSIMEEAIASSQIEGASTTRKVAKEMLRRGRSPRNKAEQMIHNNYAAIRYISENKERPLTVDIILRLHEIMTENTLDNPARRTWAGLTFEQLCKDHVPQIKKKLGISGVLSEESSWYSPRKGEETSGDGAQIDLLIDRRDQVVNICEIKFSLSEFQIDKDYDQRLRNKIVTFREKTNCRKTIQLSMITTYGVQRNKYSGIVNSEVLLDDLFQDK